MKYRVIYADPPWTFATYSRKGKGRSAESHYDCMSLQDICDYPVQQHAADDCALFLWTTHPMLQNAFSVMNAWCFGYKTIGFTWVKCSRSSLIAYPIGTGYYTRSNPELCLLGTRGRPKRISKSVRELIIAPRREHSRKPDEIYGRIEALFEGPYLELFARHKWPGWDVIAEPKGIEPRRWKSNSYPDEEQPDARPRN